MPRWKAHVQGNSFDLADAQIAAVGLAGVTVENEAEDWFLISDTFQDLVTAAEVANEAEHILQILQAVTMATRSDGEPLTLGAVVDQLGGRQFFSRAVEGVKARTRVGVITVVTRNGEEPPDMSCPE